MYQSLWYYTTHARKLLFNYIDREREKEQKRDKKGTFDSYIERSSLQFNVMVKQLYHDIDRKKENDKKK